MISVNNIDGYIRRSDNTDDHSADSYPSDGDSTVSDDSRSSQEKKNNSKSTSSSGFLQMVRNFFDSESNNRSKNKEPSKELKDFSSISNEKRSLPRASVSVSDQLSDDDDTMLEKGILPNPVITQLPSKSEKARGGLENRGASEKLLGESQPVSRLWSEPEETGDSQEESGSSSDSNRGSLSRIEGADRKSLGGLDGLTVEEGKNLQMILRKKPGNKKIKIINFQLAKSTKDLGGHGGNLKIACTQRKNGEEEIIHLFLKPLDIIELKNYQFYEGIHYHSSLKVEEEKHQIYNYMPYVYGEVNIGGKSYLMMNDSLEGGKKIALCDMKLAGLILRDEKFNPIACKLELVYNDTPKSEANYQYMRAICHASKVGYLVADSNQSRYMRGFSYGESENRFKNALEGLTIQQLESLIIKLTGLKEALLASETASIGGSIFLCKDADNDGSVEIAFIDPAHIQVNPDSPQKLFAEKYLTAEFKYKKAVFSSDDPQEFAKRVESNQVAIDGIIKTVATVRDKK